MKRLKKYIQETYLDLYRLISKNEIVEENNLYYIRHINYPISLRIKFKLISILVKIFKIKINRNKRYYSRKVMKDALEKYNNDMNNFECETNHPE